MTSSVNPVLESGLLAEQFIWICTLQGVLTCMSCVEAFVTGIKIESSDQSPFVKSTNQEIMCGCNLIFDSLKIKQSRASEGNDQVIKHTFS